MEEIPRRLFHILIESLHTSEAVNIFLNNLNPSLQIAKEISSTKLSFVDIMVLKRSPSLPVIYIAHINT